MLRLTTLGATDLRDRHGHPARDVLAQPKRVALLVHLAVECRRGPVSRERLLALFWPESDEARARNTLSQALHHLRQALGPGVIESHGANTVEIRGEHLWCDATEFADAIERGDIEMALDLYRGEFCPALLVSGAPEVEEWLGAQRRRLHSLALGAARTLAERLEAGGEAGRAARTARRALSMQPEDESEVRALLALLERCGDAAGALLAYEEFRRRMSDTIGAEPAVETSLLVEAMRRRREPAAPSADPRVAAGTDTRRAGGERPAEPQRHPRRYILAAALMLTVGVVAAWWTTHRVPTMRLDEHLVAVAPFRVAGADSALAFLREGMLDLLAAKLTGEGGLRATDPRTIASAWPRQHGALDDLPDTAALRVARALGAGRLLLGSVVGQERQLTITATLLESRRAAVRAEASVTGRLDRLPQLVDALAAQLLSGGAGEPALRLPSLTSASLPALKAYLDGRSAFRAGRYVESESDLWHAVELDSTFATAWSELVQVADWVVGSDSRARASPVAWSLRGRLSAPDRALLEASLGPDYPAWPSYRQRLETWETASRLAPERPEAWYGLGDTYFHVGQLIGRDSGFARSEAALSRAVALDSAFMAPLVHLVQIAILRGDTLAARRLWAVYVRRDSTSESAAYLRWRVAVALGDSATARRFEAAFDTLPIGVLNRVASWAVVDGVGVEPAWRAARTAVLRASGQDVELTRRVFVSLAGNLGRFAEREIVRRGFSGARSSTEVTRDIDYVNALAMDGDTAAGLAAMRRLRASALRTEPGPTACALASWMLFRLAPAADTTDLSTWYSTCIRLGPPNHVLALRALYAGQTADPRLAQLVGQLDSARQAAVGTGGANFLTLVQGMVLMMHGDFARARDALRHREVGSAEATSYYVPILRYEGRAAELAGDTAGAIAAYRHYLALRYDPDAGARFYADSVRSALGRLEPRRPS